MSKPTTVTTQEMLTYLQFNLGMQPRKNEHESEIYFAICSLILASDKGPEVEKYRISEVSMALQISYPVLLMALEQLKVKGAAEEK